MEVYIAFVFAVLVGLVVTALASTLILWFIAIFKEAFDIATGKDKKEQQRA
jgi:ABC-type protease/lipase transport system fused ATPase/permease subunit